ncbi:hypothetical protein [Bacillus tequilensis]|uniref:Uncharacterized protein n=1 Tax=Bacillus tequilensis TaxID=227866 RepID=A0A6H0WJC1_9BACI|nr:hypothetical protein [Bacillus tequilensis]QIW80288.1 hypothetical protein G4P54_11035 [Bacillus tequilensis]
MPDLRKVIAMFLNVKKGFFGGKVIYRKLAAIEAELYNSRLYILGYQEVG